MDDPELPASFPDRLAFPINYVMGAIYMALYLIAVPIFVYLRKREPIKSRGWIIPLFQMTVVLVELMIRIPGFYRVSCPVDVLRQNLLIPLWLYPYFLRVFTLWYRFNFQNILLLKQAGATPFFKTRIVYWIQSHQWINSAAAQLLFIAAVGLFSSALVLGLYFTLSSQLTEFCGFQPGFVLNTIQGASSLLFLAISVYVLWGVSDAYLLKVEFIILFATGLPLFILWAISTVTGWMGFANPGFWVNLVQISFLLATLYLPIFGTKYYKKSLRKSMTSPTTWKENEQNTLQPGYEEIRLVLDNEVLLRHFEQFMVQTWTIENLLFIRKHAAFKAASGEEKLALAQEIQRDYISEGGLCQLNLEMKDREEINEMILSNECTDNLFIRVEKHVWSLLRYSIYPLWQGSSSFKEALKLLKVASLDQLKHESSMLPSKKLDPSELGIDIQMESV